MTSLAVYVLLIFSRREFIGSVIDFCVNNCPVIYTYGVIAWRLPRTSVSNYRELTLSHVGIRSTNLFLIAHILFLVYFIHFTIASKWQILGTV